MISFRVVSASPDDVRVTIHDAHQTFREGDWRRAPAVQRAAMLSILAQHLEEAVPRLAKIESLQTGHTIREMTAQLGRLPEWL